MLHPGIAVLDNAATHRWQYALCDTELRLSRRSQVLHSGAKIRRLPVQSPCLSAANARPVVIFFAAYYKLSNNKGRHGHVYIWYMLCSMENHLICRSQAKTSIGA